MIDVLAPVALLSSVASVAEELSHHPRPSHRETVQHGPHTTEDPHRV